jgi:soluble lytic murein transglycosylase-like protein
MATLWRFKPATKRLTLGVSVRGAGARAPLGALARACCVLLLALAAGQGTVRADQLRLADGKVIEVDEAWEDAQGVWYRRGGVTHHIERSRVRSIERGKKSPVESKVEAAATESAAKSDVVVAAPQSQAEQTVWIHLKGGAEMEVDEAQETAEGVWYKRGKLSIFIDRERVERIERDRGRADEVAEAGVARPARRERAWTTGSRSLDALIRSNGARHGVDPYLIFLVIEKESSFNSRAVSPAGARGLMQLMPGTAARFGVRNPSDPAQNVSAGTRYLRQLLNMFRGRVDLALAGYNAGEGNVRKFGHRVPPFRETRNYVRTISSRYQRGI